MIQRFCFAKLSDAEVPGRVSLADKLHAELTSAGADAVVGVPADESAARWDVSIVITAASLAAWHALERHVDVRAALDDLAARAVVVKAWTFEAVGR